MTAPCSNQTSSMELAGFGRRYFAFALDALFLEILGAMIVSPIAGNLQGDRMLVSVDAVGGSGPGFFPTVFVIYFGIGAALWSLYFACFNGVSGQTPGKALLGIRICRLNGTAIKPSTALARFWTSVLVGALTLGLSYTWAAWDKWRQGWHDKLFDTVVVRPARQGSPEPLNI